MASLQCYALKYTVRCTYIYVSPNSAPFTQQLFILHLAHKLRKTKNDRTTENKKRNKKSDVNQKI